MAKGEFMAMEWLTFALVVITGIYACLTYWLAQSSEASVAAMEQQSWEASRAFITVSPFVRPHTTLLYLRVLNGGRSSALNLRLLIDKDFFQFAKANQPDHNLRNKSAFNQAIDAFHPGQELIFGLAQGWAILGNEAQSAACPAKFIVTAEYESLGKRITEAIPIDLTAYLGTEGEGEPIVEELERIRKALEKNHSVVQKFLNSKS